MTVTRDRVYLLLLTLGIPLAFILMVVLANVGGILLIIAAVLWMGFAILILGPLMGTD